MLINGGKVLKLHIIGCTGSKVISLCHGNGDPSTPCVLLSFQA